MSKTNVFINSNLEFGLRAAFIVCEFNEYLLTFEDLLVLDYIVTNINDFDSTKKSLHPHSPYRYAKLVVRRKVLKEGLEICLKKNLIDIVYSTDGIKYKSTVITGKVLEYLESSYMEKLIDNCKFVKTLCERNSLEELRTSLNDQMVKHGIEFFNSNEWECE